MYIWTIADLVIQHNKIKEKGNNNQNNQGGRADPVPCWAQYGSRCNGDCWLTKSAIVQNQIQAFELAYNIYLIYEFLENIRGLILWSIATGSPWLSATSQCLRWLPVMIQSWLCSRSQSPWNRPMTHCNEHVWLFGRKVTLCNTMQLLMPLWNTSDGDVGGAEWYVSHWRLDVCNRCERMLWFIEKQVVTYWTP